ncbi:uncharacterized protein LOC119662692 isoform X1 [Teleopsis dalmanni]|uniref:uncharacterized protein LOC119662692 isoform X1 n=1 Tax=Teleopsis dalmanni TaxID=139649 RepID=UPI0018CFA234|nr:uncharacterized protein LOC119662692 isoform X1 [Teleopsis dalmanni]XP_037928312.1 uncharacterized protein LOC119662692 isoform X1 [Teleopsis dalmanni]XP_037928313.1 uncharacterized protein LOC119662692 isoform X1 [Teleopsis dalmanni]XP_037928314.1 uncharacterized protein LOC119662692 isoform X1 [Teleopsis dalmanni]
MDDISSKLVTDRFSEQVKMKQENKVSSVENRADVCIDQNVTKLTSDNPGINETLNECKNEGPVEDVSKFTVKPAPSHIIKRSIRSDGRKNVITRDPNTSFFTIRKRNRPYELVSGSTVKSNKNKFDTNFPTQTEIMHVSRLLNRIPKVHPNKFRGDIIEYNPNHSFREGFDFDVNLMQSNRVISKQIKITESDHFGSLFKMKGLSDLSCTNDQMLDAPIRDDVQIMQLNKSVGSVELLRVIDSDNCYI